MISKYLARDETPESLTLYLLLLIVVNHAIIGIVLGILVTILPAGALPASLSTGLDLGLPTGEGVWWMLFLGLVTAAAQYLLWNAYKFADATYLQPFDDLKLPFNVLLGWIVLSQVPSALFWPGAILIIAASLYVGIMETRRALPGAA